MPTNYDPFLDSSDLLGKKMSLNRIFITSVGKSLKEWKNRLCVNISQYKLNEWIFLKSALRNIESFSEKLH